jgi:hypothetical protein
MVVNWLADCDRWGTWNQDRSATDGEGVKQGCRKGTIYKEAMKTGKDGKRTMHADGKRT